MRIGSRNYFGDYKLFCISTSKQVLHMPFVGQKNLHQRSNKFPVLFHHKPEKRKSAKNKDCMSTTNLLHKTLYIIWWTPFYGRMKSYLLEV